MIKSNGIQQQINYETCFSIKLYELVNPERERQRDMVNFL